MPGKGRCHDPTHKLPDRPDGYVVTALAAADCERLAKLLGLLGSDFAGERDNAARAVDRLVRARGLPWLDILNRPQIIPAPECRRRPDNPAPANCGRDLAACVRHLTALSERERVFIISLQRQRSRILSPKQVAWLASIAARVSRP